MMGHARTGSDEFGPGGGVLRSHDHDYRRPTARRSTRDTIVLVGTTKGLFTLRSGDGREPVRAGRADVRRRGGVRHVHRHPLGRDAAVHGIGQQPLGAGAAALRRPRRDVDRGRAGGAARSRRTPTPRWRRIWQLAPGPADEPDVMYAGVEPAALFRSDDGGRSFSLVSGLWDHPHRPQWQPGGGGLCLHTVLVHPRRPEPPADRHLGGRRVPVRRRRLVVAGEQPRDRRRLPARGRGPRVRPVRAQGGARRRRPRAPLPPAPRRHLPQRRRRRGVDAR